MSGLDSLKTEKTISTLKNAWFRIIKQFYYLDLFYKQIGYKQKLL